MLFFSDQTTYGSCAHIGFPALCLVLGMSTLPHEKTSLGGASC